MIPGFQEGIINYALITILLIYGIRGFFRNTVKSVISIILFPVSLIAYLAISIYLGRNIIIPVSFFGIIKIVIATVVLVTIARWIIYLILGSFLKKNQDEGIIERIIKRVPGAAISSFEGFMLIICMFWVGEYFDVVLQGKFDKIFSQVEENHIYKAANSFNPIYDLPGAKSIKTVLLTFSNQQYSSNFSKSQYAKRFYELPSIRKMTNDKEFQELLKDQKTRKILMHPNVRMFMKSENIFRFLTSKEFIFQCRSSIPRNQLKIIDEKEGMFSGVKFDFLKKIGKKDVIEKKNRQQGSFNSRVTLENGFVFEGKIVEKNKEGLRLRMEEGEVYFKVAEIAKIEKL